MAARGLASAFSLSSRSNTSAHDVSAALRTAASLSARICAMAASRPAHPAHSAPHRQVPAPAPVGASQPLALTPGGRIKESLPSYRKATEQQKDTLGR